MPEQCLWFTVRRKSHNGIGVAEEAEDASGAAVVREQALIQPASLVAPGSISSDGRSIFFQDII
jgi:hypothetical protein